MRFSMTPSREDIESGREREREHGKLDDYIYIYNELSVTPPCISQTVSIYKRTLAHTQRELIRACGG